MVGLESGKEHVFLVGLVFLYCPLEHDFEDLVGSLNLAISLRVISRGILVFKLQHGRKLYPNSVLKMRTVV